MCLVVRRLPSCFMAAASSSGLAAPTSGGRVVAAWAQLPACAVAGLAGIGVSASSYEELAELFGDAKDLEALMDQLDPAGSLGRVLFAEVLLELRDSAGGPAGTKRRRRAAILPSLQTLAVLQAEGARAVATQVSAVASVCLPVRAVGAPKANWRNRLQGLLAEADPQERSALEEAQRLVLVGEVIALVRRAGLPIVARASLSINPDRALMGCTGKARARTIRKRIREWAKAESWLSRVTGAGWPGSAGDVVDYLHDRSEEPCARTVPASIVGALSFLEKAGGVPLEARLSLDSLVASTADYLTVSLSKGAAPTKKAAMVLLCMVMSLELYVVDVTRPLYCRGVAWLRLVKIWASLRFDDTLGIRPELIVLTASGLEAQLERTKTSGPGRKIRWLSFFVSAKASITGVPWLRSGFGVWQGEGMCFPRDYFLPYPSEDLGSAIRKPVDWAAASAIGRALLLDLRTVVFVDGLWAQGPELMFGCKQSVLHFSEHGDRNWSRSMAALFGAPKSEGDYLGRWMPEQSDDYNRAAKQVVHRVQGIIVEGCRRDPGGVDEDLGKLELRAFLSKRGVSDVEVILQLQNLKVVTPLSGAGVRGRRLEVSDSPVLDGFDGESAAEEDVEAPKGFYVSYTLKKRFARLHRVGGCHRTPGKDIHDYVYIDGIHEAVWDEFCKQCWRHGSLPDEEEDQSSEGSSSTEGGGEQGVGQ